MRLPRFASLALPIVFLCSCIACPKNAIISSYGYSELLPPSTLLSPGAMVTIVSRNPFKVKLICGPRASLGPNWQPVVSATASRSLAKHSGKTFQVTADVLEAIKANVDLSAVTDITATLNNPQIVELEDIDIFANLKYRSPECQAAVEARVANGFQVSMISSALQGDLTYVVKWNNNANVSAKAKLDALQNLAIEIGAGNSSLTTDSIKASNLVLGARDDAYLSSITIPSVDEKTVPRASIVLTPEAKGVVEDVMHPDAPIVHPPHGEQGECHGDTCTRAGLFDAGLTPIKPRERGTHK